MISKIYSTAMRKSMQDSLFNSIAPPDNSEILALGDYEIRLFHNFLDSELSSNLLTTLQQELSWQQPCISIHGREVQIPRLQVWMGDHDAAYSYSGKNLVPETWHPRIKEIKGHIETKLGVDFNSVLCNLYRDGNDSVAWHSDNEKELDRTYPIASYSLGAERFFELKPKAKSKAHEKLRLRLSNNTLLIMPKGFQTAWQHQIPKSKNLHAPRINLTFRKALQTH